MNRLLAIFLLFGFHFIHAQQFIEVKKVLKRYDSIIAHQKSIYDAEIKGKSDKKIVEIYTKYSENRRNTYLDKQKELNQLLDDILSTQESEEEADASITNQQITENASYSLGFPNLYEEVRSFISRNDYGLGDYGEVLSCKIYFMVKKDGTLQIKKLEGNNPVFNKRALLALVMTKGTWKPASQNGKPVKSHFVLPVKYQQIEE